MNDVFNYLDELFPNPKCELIYNNDFEFLIAVVLSAQTTDSKVNKVSKVLFSKYDAITLCDVKISDLEDILKPLGMATKKSIYIKSIANDIKYKYKNVIPNTRKELMGMSGVGRKTANLVLSTLYNEPYLAVDTHVSRVCKRLSLVENDDTVLEIENKLYKIVPPKKIFSFHHQLVLFGRYYCKSINPKCKCCKLKSICKKESSYV